MDTEVERKEVIVCNQMYKGHLVRKVEVKAQEESEELGCSPTKDFKSIYNNIYPEEDFIDKMQNIGRKKGASSAFPQKSLM